MTKHAPQPLTAEILAYDGALDGIRFGRVHFSDGSRRHFMHDRLNGTVQLHGFDQGERRGVEDRSAERRAAVLAVVGGVVP